MGGEFICMIKRLAKAIDESDSYEEFALKCAADKDVAALLEYIAGYSTYLTLPSELYASIKNKSAGKRA